MAKGVILDVEVDRLNLLVEYEEGELVDNCNFEKVPRERGKPEFWLDPSHSPVPNKVSSFARFVADEVHSLVKRLVREEKRKQKK